jgi:hypothetical protein
MEKMPLFGRTRTEPRWPGWIAILGIGGLLYALPPALSLGPRWLALALMASLQAIGIGLHYRGMRRSGQILAYCALGVGTVSLLAALAFLVRGLPERRESPRDLFIAASALWGANILLFASWYWRLDAGGPYRRDLRESHTDGAFLFPQMTLTQEMRGEIGAQQWRPGFLDYFFLAFSTSTAFSPTDAPVLSRWAKVLMMTQAFISLSTLAILAARAVNIL